MAQDRNITPPSELNAIAMRYPEKTFYLGQAFNNPTATSIFDMRATIALTQFEAETRFRARATQGSAATGLQLLKKLDALTGDEAQSI